MTSNFLDWKRHPITQEVFIEIQQRIEGLKEELVYTAGADSVADGMKRGAILAFRDIIDMEMEDSK